MAITSRTKKVRGALHVLAQEYHLDPRGIIHDSSVTAHALYSVLRKQGYAWDGQTWRRRPLPYYLRQHRREAEPL